MRNILKKIMITLVTASIFLIAIFGMKIQHVEIRGNHKVSDMEIVASIFDREIDKNCLVFYVREKAKQHKKINYVNDYYVEWKSPFDIVIDIHEKPSIGYVRKNLKNVYFDKDGIINEVTEDKIGNLVEVSGIEFKNYERGQKIEAKDMKTINAILNITNSLYENELPAKHIEIDRDGEISVFVGNIVVVLGDTKNMEVKLQRLNDIYKEIEDLKGTLYLSNARENMLDEQYIFKKAE